MTDSSVLSTLPDLQAAELAHVMRVQDMIGEQIIAAGGWLGAEG